MGPNLQKALSLGGKRRRNILVNRDTEKKYAIIIKRRKSSGMSIRLFSLLLVVEHNEAVKTFRLSAGNITKLLIETANLN